MGGLKSLRLVARRAFTWGRAEVRRPWESWDYIVFYSALVLIIVLLVLSGVQDR